jgi:signal transduction histidine kinase
VLGALLAGSGVGFAMAVAGWVTFFPVVAHMLLGSIAALPLWCGTAYTVGWVSKSLLHVESEQAVAARDAEAAHALRTPLATIKGMLEVLRLHDSSPEVEAQILAVVEDETNRLLEAPIFTPTRRRHQT